MIQFMITLQPYGGIVSDFNPLIIVQADSDGDAVKVCVTMICTATYMPTIFPPYHAH